MEKWPYIANALFRIAQIHGRQSYLRRLQEGDRPNYPSVSAHAPGTLKSRLFALQFMQTTACDLVPDVRLICCVMLTQAERDVKTWSEWNKPILKLSQRSLTAMQTNVFIEYITKEQRLRVPIRAIHDENCARSLFDVIIYLWRHNHKTNQLEGRLPRIPGWTARKGWESSCQIYWLAAPKRTVKAEIHSYPGTLQ